MGARTSWYPNLGSFDDVATYAMTFRFSVRNDLIAVGEQVSERTEGSQKIALWRSQQPIRVAGFNYGDFQKTSRTDSESGHQRRRLRDSRTLSSPTWPESPLADTVNTARVGRSVFRRDAVPACVDHAAANSWRQRSHGRHWSFCPPSRFCRHRSRNAGLLEIHARCRV